MVDPCFDKWHEVVLLHWPVGRHLRAIHRLLCVSHGFTGGKSQQLYELFLGHYDGLKSDSGRRGVCGQRTQPAQPWVVLEWRHSAPNTASSKAVRLRAVVVLGMEMLARQSRQAPTTWGWVATSRRGTQRLAHCPLFATWELSRDVRAEWDAKGTRRPNGGMRAGNQRLHSQRLLLPNSKSGQRDPVLANERSN